MSWDQPPPLENRWAKSACVEGAGRQFWPRRHPLIAVKALLQMNF